MTEALRAELARAAGRLGHEGVSFVLERPRDVARGDLATNLAMVLARLERASPRATAQRLAAELELPASLVERTEIAGPGFLNFQLANDALAGTVRRILAAGPRYGCAHAAGAAAGAPIRVVLARIEPGRPLTAGQGRGAVIADAVATLLERTGHRVSRELYGDARDREELAALAALGVRCDALLPGDALAQSDSGTPVVRLVRGGRITAGGRRGGAPALLRALVDEIGPDATRWFFLMRRAGDPVTLDVDLARRQSEENPAFRVTLAHARLAGMVHAEEPGATGGDATDLDPAAISSGQDRALLRPLGDFPGLVMRAARDREPYRVAVFAEEVAEAVHGWYHHTRTVGEAPAVARARFLLARAARVVLSNALGLLGLSAPDRM